MNSLPDNFLGLSEEHSRYDGAAFAVLPIPYEATVTYNTGTRNGPRAIITASQQVELYDLRLERESHTAGIATLTPLEPDARGPESMQQRILDAAEDVVRDGKFLIGLGGEHSVTLPLVQAVRSRHKRLSVLQIDAHADLRDEYHESKHSHACVMRRIHDLNVPATGVGIRNVSVEECRFIKEGVQPIFTARQCHEEPDWISSVVGSLQDEVYVTIDIDGFDPAIAPGTGTPEPGGLTWYQVVDLLEALAQQKRIVACDCVEVRPLPDNPMTEFLAAKLLYRIIGLVHATHGPTQQMWKPGRQDQ